MRSYASRLRDDLGIPFEASNHLATVVESDLHILPRDRRGNILLASPVGCRARRDELIAFQRWSDFAEGINRHPEITRAQVIVQNYICFVYLPESLFKTLRQELPGSSATGKCCKFLTDNPVRAFRNALAHGNWKYNKDFTGIVYWARKGGNPEEPLTKFEVLQVDLNFWQALSRCIAYVTYTELT